ncbi:MAG: FAD-binding protein [Clostridiales bacterium]|nr:FAD-binding protein [Clostridiales bacterium]
MIKRLDNLKLNIKREESDLIKVAEKAVGAKFKYFKILKKSLDARDKNNIFWLYSIAYSTENETLVPKSFKKISSCPKIVVVGSGPAGLCCAIRLVEHGFKPIIVERGGPVEERDKAVNLFISERVLNKNSNVQFGEGGAGTFSDGKLNTQTKDGLNKEVLEIFVRFGAPQEILYLNKPHIGSDILKGVLVNIRKYLEENGAIYLFNTQFVSFESKDDKIVSVKLKNTINGNESQMQADGVVIALGHSARDTFEMLNGSGVLMEAKDFAVGVRIEHLNKNISFAQYGKNYNLLPSADYKLVSHAHERTVFSFCMCPGGVVIPSSSEEGGVVTNGMSLYARDGKNSNSALMVQMRKSDFGADDLFAGMRFQRDIERRAYIAGGSNYKAPVQLFKDFAKDKLSNSFGEVLPTYGTGVNFAPLSEVLPKIAVDALKVAIPDMAKRLKGFDSGDAIITGAETRFSSPVKIIRDEKCRSVSYKNLFPCGEGSGYSGGITSSAADGLKTAENIFEIFDSTII